MSAQALGANEIPSCHGGLENLNVEYDYDLEDVEGELPTDIRGTFYRNGPGSVLVIQNTATGLMVMACCASSPLMKARHIFAIGMCEHPST